MRRFALLPLLLLLALAMLVGTPRPAHAQEPPDVAINQVDADGYPAISAVVTAIDARGVPAPGLTAADFRAFEGSDPLTISSVTAAQDSSVPLSVILMIDVSGSMAGAPIDAAKAAASQFVASLAPADQAALYAFAGAVNVVVPLTADRAALNAGIAGLQAEGPTALYQAVETAVFAANASPGGRKAIVLLSDGVNDCAGCVATRDGSITAARGAGVPIFAVGLGEPDDAYLQFLADETQGLYQRVTAGGLVDVYTGIAALLRAQYIVTMQAAGAADGADASLRIEATIDGESVSSPPTAFTRGAPGAVATPVPTAVVPPPPDGGDGDGGAGGATIAMIAMGVALFVALAAGLLFLVRRTREQRRALARQQATVAPNPRLAAAQTVPQPEAAARVDPAQGTGRLSIIEGAGAGRVVQVTSLPLSIGADGRSDITIERRHDVASRHAQVWMRDGKMMLRHLAGEARQTRVNGKAVDWVIVEAGDEIAIGGTRLQVAP